MIGKTLGHYQITEKLGEGGMGVVYKARDTHLDRFAALKVLPPEKVSDPDRKRRFIQEAKAASALNHPSIITIYDIDQADGIDYIAMEYVAGKTLDELIPRKGMRLSLALKYAVQIADALARAHGAGIIHRDLKPSNVMVDEHWLVKVLDFGLAKLTEAAGPEAETAATRTGAGMILGTAAYMSPEQAEGKPIDTRSDIFSFGSMLYEMLTGQRAFRGDTRASTIASILREDPKPISQVSEGLPREVERIVRRCLRKDPEHRFQAMPDLRVALEELKEESDSGALETAGEVKTKPRRRLVWAFAVVAALAIAGVGAWFVRSRTGAAEAPLVAVPLTSYMGFEGSPSFSPDGTQVAFGWCKEGPGANCDIYIKQIGVEPPSQLTSDPAEDYGPAWSPDGQFIAFIRKLSPTSGAIVLLPQRGGQERMLAQVDISRASLPLPGWCLSWTPDSKWIAFSSPEAEKGIWALHLLSIETGERRKLTNPPADAEGDSAPAFSPDGRTLAFGRQVQGWRKSDLCLLPLGEGYKPQGEPEKVRLDSAIVGAAWMSDGREILFSTGDSLWRVSASNPSSPRRLEFAHERAFAVAVSRQRNRLAYETGRDDSNIWRIDLQGPDGKSALPMKFISSTRWERNPRYSPDGKRIAFASERSGNNKIWVCNSDGSNPVQLTSLYDSYAPAWSPDGQRIAFDATIEGNRDVYVISSSGSMPQRLTTEPSEDRSPTWSRDGQSIYFSSNRSGAFEIWRMPTSGGQPVQITRNSDGADLPCQSPDGRFVYYSKGYPFPQQVWRVPSGGGEQIRVLDAVHPEGLWIVGKAGIYYFTVPDKQGHTALSICEFATGKSRNILTIDRPVAEMIEISPDGRTILYPQVDEASSDLMLVENFR